MWCIEYKNKSINVESLTEKISSWKINQCEEYCRQKEQKDRRKALRGNMLGEFTELEGE
jgi:hypothetical protein